MTTGKVLPAYYDILKNYSMMLVNTHPSVATAWRVPPSVREIAGYHIKLPVPELDVVCKKHHRFFFIQLTSISPAGKLNSLKL